MGIKSWLIWEKDLTDVSFTTFELFAFLTLYYASVNYLRQAGSQRKSRVVSFFRVSHINRRLHKSELDKSLVLPLSRDNNIWGLHEEERLHKSELDQSLVLPLSRDNNIWGLNAESNGGLCYSPLRPSINIHSDNFSNMHVYWIVQNTFTRVTVYWFR